MILLMLMVPFWYTQLLPRAYVDTLTSDTVELETARESYLNLRSFPGHSGVADNLYRGFVTGRARSAETEEQITRVAEMAAGPAASQCGSQAERSRQSIAVARSLRSSLASQLR